MLESKRTTALFLSLVMMMSMSACAGQTTQETEGSVEYVFESETVETTFGIASYVKNSYWLGSETGEFENVSYLSLVVDLDEAVLTDGDNPGYYYTVSKDGEQIFVSETIVLEEPVMNCTFGTVDGDLLPSGTYSVTCFDDNGAIIAGASASVVETPIVAPDMSEDWEPYDDDEYLNSYTYSFTDEDFEGLVDLEKTSWWDYSDTSVGLSAYASDTAVLGFSLVFKEMTDENLYYAYYFTEDGNFSEDDENIEPIFVNRVSLSQYADFVSYDIDVKPGKIQPGYYCFIVARDSSFENIVAEGSCLIVSETSEEIAEEE